MLANVSFRRIEKMTRTMSSRTIAGETVPQGRPIPNNFSTSGHLANKTPIRTTVTLAPNPSQSRKVRMNSRISQGPNGTATRPSTKQQLIRGDTVFIPCGGRRFSTRQSHTFKDGWRFIGHSQTPQTQIILRQQLRAYLQPSSNMKMTVVVWKPVRVFFFFIWKLTLSQDIIPNTNRIWSFM